MNNYYKTRKLRDEIKNRNVENLFNCFSVEESDVFELDYINNGTNLRMIIVVDDTNWILVRYTIAINNNPVKKEKIMELLNDLNCTRRIKYYLSDDNTILGEFSYFALDEDFNESYLLEMAISFLRSIEREDYSKIMRILWG